MAVFRKIEVKFWSDPFIESLTPEQKFFYLYLMTNEKTTQCGIYECSVRKMSIDTGYNQETIRKLIQFFESKRKIKYSKITDEVCLTNWLKYNDSTSPTVKKCIESELSKVKDRLLIEYIYGSDTHSQEEEEKEEVEEEVEVKKKKEKKEKKTEPLSFRSQLWEKWFDYKKQRKQSYTEIGKNALLNKFLNVPDNELEMIIEQSIVNNWSGLFPLKEPLMRKPPNGTPLDQQDDKPYAIVIPDDF